MTQIILNQIKPNVITKLSHLAQQHQRTLEQEITAILEDVTENDPMINSQNEDDFFAMAGLWENRNITLESIRQEAWQKETK